ncbi:ATP-binding protein [Oceanospirillum linum]|uniref:Sensor protein FixL n=1 Tax=Oceanospirillum linum TaxID=966 RepID=A0A1T1H9Z7_OCELI|nr:ATP-binding protein [Oceanospirillum linum]OOV86678.1 histidine kinase [Oceanospirillum linum]SEG26547.1 PAS domain S-box-containing protein [Oleiphilus messinensis]SMP27710.1 PAS domain S-box-containing protein [Oceanospirillum linum]
MSDPLLPVNETERLQHLHELAILDSGRDAAFDRLTELARDLFDTPIALVSLVDKNRQWFKSEQGFNCTETHRDISFCSHAISLGENLIIPDTLADEQFRDNPLVTGERSIRFYAGIPISISDGLHLGSFCILDTRPRTLSAREVLRLEQLARQAEELIRLHQQTLILAREKNEVGISRARYRAIVDSAAAGIIRINHLGTILEVNPFAQQLLDYSEEELKGQNVKVIMPNPWAREHDDYLSRFMQSGQAKIIGKGREVEARRKDGTRLPIHLGVSEVHSNQPEERQFIGILSDLQDVRAAQRAEQQEKALLKILHQGLTDYQALLSKDKLWAFLMEALRELTDSEYAFIGEVLLVDGRKALKLHAITDLSWSKESKLLMDKLVAGDMLLSNPDTLIGKVFADEELIIDNKMQERFENSHLPPGHPELYRYMGVPIFDQGEVIGMFAIANGQKDYQPELAEWLNPFTSTCALLIRLYRQMHEREQINGQLRQARDAAQQASQAKSEFLSSMSHELRTPMNAILGFAQLLQSGKHPLTDRQQRHVKQIYKSGQHLLALINDVLDLARIEAGRISVSLESLNVREMMLDALAGLQPIADQYQILLQPDESTDQTIWVTADYTRCQQVLINLVTNAIKYNRPEGQVFIRCKTQGNQLRIEVEDTGEGISSDQLEQLFQPFSRLGAENSAIEGTGIGLALSQQLVELMQGRIGVESEEHKGSCFWFTLPLADQSSAEHHNPTQKTDAEQKGIHLLYVEDNPANQRLLKAFVDEHPAYRLSLASSAEIALEMAASDIPDLILMDLDLPGITGVQAQKMLSRNPLTRKIPVIAVSAAASDKCRSELMSDGFIDYLNKPLDLDQLLQTLQKQLEH